MDPPDEPAASPAPRVSVAEEAARYYTRGARWSSLAVALLAHAGLLALLAFIVVRSKPEPPPEFVVAAVPSEKPAELERKDYATRNQPRPSAPSRASHVIATVAAAKISVPSTDLVLENPGLGIGTGFGDGYGDGFGDGMGGGVTFFGNAASAKRVAFIIDVSRSLSDTQFAMIKKELNKSLGKLSAQTLYQVLFFCGPAWFAGDKYLESESAVESGGRKYGWKSRGIHDFEPVGAEDKLYTAKWRQATPGNLAETGEHIAAVERSLGTDWRWPLKLALRLSPKPDVVYFLTDGAVDEGDRMVDEVVRENGRGAGPPAVINTIAMMQPQAAADLLEMAKRTKGTFTVVNADGTAQQVGR